MTGPDAGKVVFAFDAIGTRWEIETPDVLSEGLRGQILERAEGFDAVYSRFRPDSLVSQIAAAPSGGHFVFPDDAAGLFDLYDRLSALTGGAMDPLVGRDLELLGYDPDYSLTPASRTERAAHARTRPAWHRDVKREGTVLRTRRPLVIDVGAAGKGHLVDLLSALLEDAGITRFVIDASGDLRHAGGHPIRIGLEHPTEPGRVIGVANLADAALCASATTRRTWGPGLHHILDARTGTPVDDIVATWVIAHRTAVADALATALFLTPAHRLAGSFPFSGVRMHADGRTETFGTFDGTLFTTDQT
ncbi:MULTISPECIES: FAD:protein FMN transferase [unclassified Streptomyces]|uniref:FAD:protein FMN transferase n=1 Tax=unclassified Streptomyces TaxID=2593676 RepID=UPI00039C6DB7|nr:MULTISPECIES: FAD:protein FMN transferase [unclassified Streptomyces]